MLDFLKNPKERTRFMRFCIVGILGAVVDFGVMNLLISLTSMSSQLASSISFVAAVISNFFWNHFWAYPDSRKKSVLHKLVQFFVVSLIGLGIRFLLFSTIEEPIIRLSQRLVPADFFLSGLTIGHNLTLVIAILIVLIWNFIANRFWTYNDIE